MGSKTGTFPFKHSMNFLNFRFLPSAWTAGTKPLPKLVGQSAWLGRLLLLCLAGNIGVAADSARPFLHPDRIRYDNQCLTIDGRDVFIYSGAFHYFRCPKELWRDRFQKIKEAGFNCVETYVAWNASEPQMPSGLDDFSKVDLVDLDDWLSLAQEFGFYVIVRPGPYICAEWDTGGYPQWLLAKQPASPLRSQGWLRSDDPVYLAWCKHWYDAVCPVIAKHQITRQPVGKPGVILVQMENEYDFANFPDEVKINQVKALATDARADGIDVPLITCWTHQVRGATDPVLRQIFDCCNFYPGRDVDSTKENIDKLRREQPDAPVATTELQGGWFSKVGGQLSEDNSAMNGPQINNLTLFAIQNGETMLNYYMLFGGSNLGDRAARDLTTSYDYAAPIREWGGVGERYQRVWALGHMLRAHGADLARTVAINAEVQVSQPDVTVVERRATDGGRYFFVRTSQFDQPREGTALVKEMPSSGTWYDTQNFTFKYSLEPFGSKVLYLPPTVVDTAQGEWLPKAAPAIERPTDLPASVVITSARSRIDAGPTHWKRLLAGENLAQAGVYDSHFIFYRARISCATPTNLLVGFPKGDAVLALVNGHPAAAVGGSSGSAVFSLGAGANDVHLLYENHGHDNGGLAMAAPCGLLYAQQTVGLSPANAPVAGWRMHLVDGTDNRPEVATDYDDQAWPATAVDNSSPNQLTPGQMAVFRAVFDVPAAHLSGGQMMLNLGCVDDLGWVYVNGQSVGTTTDWSRPYAFDVTQQLHPGRNIVAVVVKNVGGPGGLGVPGLDYQTRSSAVQFKFLGRPTGDEKQWWLPELADSDWQSVNLGDASSATNGGPWLTWYRMNFALPAPSPGVWVPWRVHLMAHGNGFLYLNGHAIGRYWEAGPQHDFFLPECWLNFGAGQTNNLTLNLRPNEQGTGIQLAVVEPYAAFAEKR
jgi:hypothetical protein